VDIDAAIDLVIGLAHDYSVETRIRRLIESHTVDGLTPRTLVMSTETWHALVEELNGRKFGNGYYWSPASSDITFFRGLPILIKDYVAEGDILVGV